VRSLFEILSQVSLYEQGLRSSIPILLAGLGGLLCARVGVFNIALEGKMLIGAFAAVAGSWFLGGAFAGVLVAVAVGALLGLFMAMMTVRLRADVIVLGVGLNLAALGVTVFLLQILLHVRGVFYNEKLEGLPRWRLGPLGDVPLLGRLIAGETPLFYLALLLVPLTAVLLFRTRWGLRLRAVGEHPLAAATLGVSPARLQTWVVTLAGGLCGLAGAQLALGQVRQFSENMTAGRGFIALVAVLLARSNPWGVAIAAIGFGITDALSVQLQALTIPDQIVRLIPYVLALLALVLFRGARVPGLAGQAATAEARE
jgi:ABC-type uncharacterized transport system permease subunit